MKITRLRIGLTTPRRPDEPDDENHYWAEAIEEGGKYYYRARGVTVETTEYRYRAVIQNPYLYYFSSAFWLHGQIKGELKAREASAPTTDPREQGWPRFAEFPQTEAGWNDYANLWVARRRRTSGTGQIPMWAIEEYQKANALAARMHWQDNDNELHEGAKISEHMKDEDDAPEDGGTEDVESEDEDEIPKDEPWPLFEHFERSEAGYALYLSAWIRRLRAVQHIRDIPAKPLIERWLAFRLAEEQRWPDEEAMENHPENDARDRLLDVGECVYSLFWDSGGPGAGAEEERIYRWEGKFFFFSDYWDVPNPFKSLDDALGQSGLLNVNTATRWIRCKLLSAEDLVPKLSVGNDVTELEINHETWLYDSASRQWSRDRR